MDWNVFDQKAKPLGLLNMVVYREGKKILEHGYEEEVRRNQYSASKSFTSIAVGIAEKEGLLSLDEPLTQAFSQEIPENPCPELQRARVEDLLTMCLGQAEAHLMGPQRISMPERDWVRFSLKQPFSHMPGEQFLYNNVGPYLAGVLVQRRAGCDLVHYLMPRLFEPLGIQLPTWETDPFERTFGAGGLFLGVSELALFGQLLLQGGNWKGRQLVPEDYVCRATEKRVENGGEGYGYLFWRGPGNSYRADGKYSQLAVVFPDDRLMIAINSECRDGQGMMDLLMEYRPVFLQE